MVWLSKNDRLKKYSIYIFLLVFIVSGNALTFQLFGRAAIKLSDVLAIFLGLILLHEFMKCEIDFSIGIMSAWGLWSLLLICCNLLVFHFTAGDALTAVLYLLRFMYMLWLGYVTARWVKKKGLMIEVLKYINILYLAVCFIGFFQLIFFPVAYDFYGIFWNIGVYFPDADPHVGRLISTYFDPNYLASCLTLGICVNYFLMEKSRGTSAVWWYRVAWCIYLLTVFLTKSRSGFVGFAICFVFYFLFTFHLSNLKIEFLPFIFLALAVLLYLFFFSDISTFVRIRNSFNDPSSWARLSSWEKGWEMAKKTGFFGVGYNLNGALSQQMYGAVHDGPGYGNDSSLLLTLITTGFIGCILFGMHIYHLLRRTKHSKCVIGLIVSALVICNFNNLLYYNLWVFMFYFIIYLMLPLKDKAEDRQRASAKIQKRLSTGDAKI